MANVLALIVEICAAVLIYHLIIYPALVFFLAQLMPRPVRHSFVEPLVSVITAAHDEAPIIRRKLENSLALDYPNLEILVVSDGSTDGTNTIIREFDDPRIQVLVVPERRGKSSAINQAAACARGEILLISDANAFCDPRAVRMIVRNFADPDVGLVSGHVAALKEDSDLARLRIACSEGAYWTYESFIKRQESRLGFASGVVGSLLAIRRDLFVPIPPDVINDDMFLLLDTLRRGYRALYEPQALSSRLPSRNPDDERCRRQRITAGRLQQLLKLRSWPWNAPLAVFFLFSHKFIRLLLPFFMIGALLANSALLLVPPIPPILQVTLLAQFAFWGLAALGLIAEKLHKRWRVPNLAYYIVLGNLGSLRGLLSYATSRQTVLWQKASR